MIVAPPLWVASAGLVRFRNLFTVSNGYCPKLVGLVIHHAAERWAACVVSAVECDHDPRTLEIWARASGVSVGAIRTWCRAAGESPRNSLYFCRMLRAISLASNATWDAFNLLDIVDGRTLRTFLAKCGFDSKDETPTLDRFLRDQSLILNTQNIQAVIGVMAVRKVSYRRSSSDCDVYERP
jgi:hypothetical protein